MKSATRSQMIAIGVETIRTSIVAEATKLGGAATNAEQRATADVAMRLVLPGLARDAVDSVIRTMVTMFVDQTFSAFEEGASSVTDSIAALAASDMADPNTRQFVDTFIQASREIVVQSRKEWQT